MVESLDRSHSDPPELCLVLSVIWELSSVALISPIAFFSLFGRIIDVIELRVKAVDTLGFIVDSRDGMDVNSSPLRFDANDAVDAIHEGSY